MAVGQFYFAWVEPEETTFDPSHVRNDAGLLQFQLEHRENDFARLTITTLNPQIGILNPARKQWAWFSVDDGAEDVVPLFFGRVIGLPENLQSIRISLTFRARPANFNTLKQALADTLKVAPFWDRVWLDDAAAADPDTVLLARAQSWHIDPVTHAVTVSDNIVGEDGTLTFDGDDILADSLNTRYVGLPASQVRVRGEIGWTQRAVGELDVSSNLIEAFRLVGTTQPFMISSYTGGGLVSSWPLPGDDLGGGWSVAQSDVIDGRGRWTPPEEDLDNVAAAWAPAFRTPFGNFGTLEASIAVNFHLWVLKPTLVLKYDAERSRTEIVEFTLAADVQPLLTDPDDADIISIELSSNDAGEPVDTGTVVPIDDLRRNAYVTTARGMQSVEYLMMRARAELLDRARAVEVSWQMPFEKLFGLSLRKNAVVQDDMIPGGQAQGKITGYVAVGDGDSGEFALQVFIGCTIGQGNAVSPAAGTPDYCSIDYCGNDYQNFSGANILLAPGDVTYADYRNVAVDDDGINFFDMKASDLVEGVLVTNGPLQQRTAVEGFYKDVPEAIEAVQAVFTRVCLTMTPVAGGPFETTFALTTSDLVIPKQIDLEAAAV